MSESDGTEMRQIMSVYEQMRRWKCCDVQIDREISKVRRERESENVKSLLNRSECVNS